MTKEEKFIEEMAVYVLKYAKQYNVLCPSAVLAQFCLESGYGVSELAVNANNYAGLKYRPNRCPTASGTYTKIGGEQDAVTGRYTSSTMLWFAFKSKEDFVRGYFDFTNISNYKAIKGVSDPRTYLENIKRAGYATSIKYVDNLMAVIEKYNLTKYDNQTNEVNKKDMISTELLNETINSIKIDASILSNVANYQAMNCRDVKYIVMHYTGNSKDLASNNAKYFANGSRKASAHFFCDDTSIYQSVKLKDVAWHCGGSKYYHSTCRNSNSIGIEMCCSGNYIVSEKTKENAAYLCARLCKLIGIAANEVDTYVLRHYDVTYKNCPRQMAGANNTEWNTFKQMVKSILTKGLVVVTPTTQTSNPAQVTTPFLVQLLDDLNIRQAPSINGAIVKANGAKKGIKYTIVEVSGNWGLLKSYAKNRNGWISISDKYVKRV